MLGLVKGFRRDVILVKGHQAREIIKLVVRLDLHFPEARVGRADFHDERKIRCLGNKEGVRVIMLLYQWKIVLAKAFFNAIKRAVNDRAFKVHVYRV